MGIRIFSLATVALISRFTELRLFLSLFFAIGMGHYFTAFFYSQRRLRGLLADPRGYVALSVLAIIGVLLGSSSHPMTMFYYFGLHHALTEAYCLDQASVSRRPARERWLRLTRLILYLSSYLLIIRNTGLLHSFPIPIQPLLPMTLIVSSLAGSLIAWAILIAGQRRDVPKAVWRDGILCDLVQLVIVAGSIWINVNFYQFVLYHFLIWVFIPLPAMLKGGGARIWRYLLVTVATTAFFFLFSPSAGLPFGFDERQLGAQVTYWGFIHITATFALSAMNPGLIRRLFSGNGDGQLRISPVSSSPAP